MFNMDVRNGGNSIKRRIKSTQKMQYSVADQVEIIAMNAWIVFVFIHQHSMMIMLVSMK
jgi:hypothetical protein